MGIQNSLCIPGQLCFPFVFFPLSFFQTEKGSALHEAALFGKVDVVRVLLETGSYCGSPILLNAISISGIDKSDSFLHKSFILSSL